MSKKFLNLEEQHEVIRTKMANWQELRSDLEVLRNKEKTTINMYRNIFILHL